MAMPIVSVFVSSTWLDLQPERAAVEHVLNQLRETKLSGMEYFGSQSEDTRETSLAEVDRSDLYLGVIGGRYGSGITEAEYDRARQRGLKCIIFFKAEEAVPASERGGEPEKYDKLARFKSKLKTNHIVGEPFRTPEQLALGVMASLHRWLVDEHLPGVTARGAADSSADRIGSDAMRGMISALLEGIQRVRADYSVRIKNFCAEYLGSEGKLVPFGGRDRELRYLDDWLADEQRSPYLLLTAPAGRGKSALLLRWARALTAQGCLEVVFIPVSARFRTNLASAVFGSMAARLAEVHGERLAYSDAEDWRALCTAYLARAVPADKKLIVVLDGIDEASDWEIGADIFSPDPPAGLRVVVSARAGPDDKQAGWLAKLGWTDTALAERITLDQLDFEGFAGLLRSDKFLSQLLARQPEIEQQLFATTGGDPLLLSLYLQEVRAQTARGAGPIMFADVPKGLPGVLSLWERDLRERLKGAAEGTLVAAQRLCSVLAAAFGPLRRVDLHEMCGEKIGSWALDAAVDALARFLVGEGETNGYAFTHPRLAQHFFDRLAERERRELDQQFVTWGRRAISGIELNAGSARAVAPYLVQYLAAHMQRSNAPIDELLALLSAGWKDACFAAEATYSKFVGDVAMVRLALVTHDRKLVAQGSRPRYLGEEFLCMLCDASTRSHSNNLTGFVLTAALAADLITLQQCIQLVEHRSRYSVGSKKDLLVFVLEHLPVLRDTLGPLVVQSLEREYPLAHIDSSTVWAYREVLPVLGERARAPVVAHIAHWIEERWRALCQLADSDNTAARTLLDDFDVMPSGPTFGCIRAFLEPYRARLLADLYVEALRRVGYSLSTVPPQDAVDLLPALAPEKQMELLDAWFDEKCESNLTVVAGALWSFDNELPAMLKRRYGAVVARRLESQPVEQLDGKASDLLLLALRWCDPADVTPLVQNLGSIIRRQLGGDRHAVQWAKSFVKWLPLNLRESAALTLIDELAAENLDDDILRLVLAHRHLIDELRRARFAEAARQADDGTRSAWLATEALLGANPNVDLARQAWQLALKIGDSKVHARAYAAFAADAPAPLREKCVQGLIATLPWATDGGAKQAGGTGNPLTDERDILEILLAAQSLASPEERDRMHSQAVQQLDDGLRARYRLERAARFEPEAMPSQAAEALTDIAAVSDTQSRADTLVWTRRLVPDIMIEQWAQCARAMADNSEMVRLVAELLPRLPEATRPEWRDWVISVAQGRVDDPVLVEALATACALLPAGQGLTATQAIFEQLLASLMALRNPDREHFSPALALQAILWSLTLERQGHLIEALEHATDPSKVRDCLSIVAGRLDPSLVERALALARASGASERAQLLLALAARCENERRLPLQREALLMAAESREVESVFLAELSAFEVAPLADAIVAMARARPRVPDSSSWLPVLRHATSFSLDQLFDIWEAVLSGSTRDSRQFALAHASDIAWLIDTLGGAEARHACAEAVLAATTWWP
jgi:hypothetical protein